MHLTYFVCNFFRLKLMQQIKQEDVYLYGETHIRNDYKN